MYLSFTDHGIFKPLKIPPELIERSTPAVEIDALLANRQDNQKKDAQQYGGSKFDFKI